MNKLKYSSSVKNPRESKNSVSTEHAQTPDSANLYQRLGVYFKEMFPLSYVLLSLVVGACYLSILILVHQVPLTFLWEVKTKVILSSVTLMLLTLLLRIMDELKDFADDKIHFPHRPLPSGRVELKDLTGLMYVVSGLILLLNSYELKVFWWVLIPLGFSWLMKKWFFLEKPIRKNLLLAFITHHPIVYLQYLYLFLIFQNLIGTNSLIVIENESYWYCLPLAFSISLWEFSRKIRAPKDESLYNTYSKILGPRISVMITIFLQVFIIISVSYFFYLVNFPVLGVGLWVILMLTQLHHYTHFLMHLESELPLKIYAERIMSLTILGMLSPFIWKIIQIFNDSFIGVIL
jgi:hypothetical protein